MHFNGENFEKLIFWKLLKPKSLFSLDIFYLMWQWLIANCYGHMTKMADMPIYGKTL